jgi:hypothetical protein
MNATEFIKRSILENTVANLELQNSVVEKALTRYKRNQFETVSELVNESRVELNVQHFLEKGITASEYAKKVNITYYRALKHLKKHACARYKGNNNAWIYRC